MMWLEAWYCKIFGAMIPSLAVAEGSVDALIIQEFGVLTAVQTGNTILLAVAATRNIFLHGQANNFYIYPTLASRSRSREQGASLTIYSSRPGRQRQIR